MVPALFFAAFGNANYQSKNFILGRGLSAVVCRDYGHCLFLCRFLTGLPAKYQKAVGAKNLILTTLAAIIATLPLILFNFGVLSLSAPLVNVLILPVVPLTMLFGFLVGLPFVGPGFAMVANWLLLYILKVTVVFCRPALQLSEFSNFRLDVLGFGGRSFWNLFWVKIYC